MLARIPPTIRQQKPISLADLILICVLIVLVNTALPVHLRAFFGSKFVPHAVYRPKKNRTLGIAFDLLT